MNPEFDFKTQMDFVRERNRIKYENRVMKEEDIYSQNAQALFLQEKKRKEEMRKKEEDMKRREEEMKMEQIRIQTQIEREQRELTLFMDSYISNKIERLYKMNQYDINFDDLKREAENIFYERLLKSQQDEEYKQTLINDSRKK